MTFGSSFGKEQMSRRRWRPVFKDFRAQARPQPSQGNRRLTDRVTEEGERFAVLAARRGLLNALRSAQRAAIRSARCGPLSALRKILHRGCTTLNGPAICDSQHTVSQSVTRSDKRGCLATVEVELELENP
jgi:hypothetical protein